MFTNVFKTSKKSDLNLNESKFKPHWLSAPRLNMDSPLSMNGIGKFFSSSIPHVFKMHWGPGARKRFHLSRNVYNVSSNNLQQETGSNKRRMVTDALGLDCGVVLVNSNGVDQDRLTIHNAQSFQASTPRLQMQPTCNAEDSSISSLSAYDDSGVNLSVRKNEASNVETFLYCSQIGWPVVGSEGEPKLVSDCVNYPNEAPNVVETWNEYIKDDSPLEAWPIVGSVGSKLISDFKDAVDIWSPQPAWPLVGSVGPRDSTGMHESDSSYSSRDFSSGSSAYSSSCYSSSLSSQPPFCDDRQINLPTYDRNLMGRDCGDVASALRQTCDNLASVIDLTGSNEVGFRSIYSASAQDGYKVKTWNSENGDFTSHNNNSSSLLDSMNSKGNKKSGLVFAPLEYSISAPCVPLRSSEQVPPKIDHVKSFEKHRKREFQSNEPFLGVSMHLIRSILELQHAIETGSILEDSNLDPNDSQHLRLLDEFCAGWERRWCLDCEAWVACECQAVRHGVLEHRVWNPPYVCSQCWLECDHPLKLIHHIQVTHEPPNQHATGLSVYTYPRL